MLSVGFFWSTESILFIATKLSNAITIMIPASGNSLSMPSDNGVSISNHHKWTHDVEHVLATVDLDLRYEIFHFFWLYTILIKKKIEHFLFKFLFYLFFIF